MVIEYYPNRYNGHDRFIEFGLLHRYPVQKTKMASTEVSADPLKYELISESDTDAVIEMLKQSFYKDEPLNVYLDLGDCDDLTQYCKKSLKDGCSFKTVNSSGEIVGVVINGMMQRPAPDHVPESAAAGCDHPKFKKILGLMDLVESKYDFFANHMDVDQALEMKILSVDSRYRGLGISHELTRVSMEYMKANIIPVYFVLCTSHFSARVMKKLNFECEFVLPFTEYVQDGEQVLKPDPPHLQAEVMIKKIALDN